MLERFAFDLTHSDNPFCAKIKPWFAADIGDIFKNQGAEIGAKWTVPAGLAPNAASDAELALPDIHIALRPVHRRATAFGTSRMGQVECKTF